MSPEPTYEYRVVCEPDDDPGDSFYEHLDDARESKADFDDDGCYGSRHAHRIERRAVGEWESA